MTVGPTGWRSYSRLVTIPKFPPPPRTAQNRSGSSWLLARKTLPSAATSSIARRLSSARPYLPISQPSPPPRVSPAMPVVETTPPVTARLKLRFAVELTPSGPALRPHRSADSIDVKAFHGRQVNHYPAIDGRASCHVVAAATNRDQKAEPGREIDGIHDIGHTAASVDQCRPF